MTGPYRVFPKTLFRVGAQRFKASRFNLPLSTLRYPTESLQWQNAGKGSFDPASPFPKPSHDERLQIVKVVPLSRFAIPHCTPTRPLDGQDRRDSRGPTEALKAHSAENLSGLRSDSPWAKRPRGRMGAGFLACHSPRHCRRLDWSFFPERERTPQLPRRESSGGHRRALEEPWTVGTRGPRTRQESPICNSRVGLLWLRGSTVRPS